jgi:hypothetical protein
MVEEMPNMAYSPRWSSQQLEGSISQRHEAFLVACGGGKKMKALPIICPLFFIISSADQLESGLSRNGRQSNLEIHASYRAQFIYSTLFTSKRIIIAFSMIFFWKETLWV